MMADVYHAEESNPIRLHGRVYGREIDIQIPGAFLGLLLLGAGSLISSIGALVFLRYAYSFLRLFLELTVIPGTNINKFRSPNGKTWAIVTGSTGGIGLEFARQLAAKGYNIILVGRRERALQEISAQLQTEYGVDTKSVTVDVSNPESRTKAFSQIETMISGLDLGIIVNNVGQGYDMPVSFAETDAAEIEGVLQTNLLWTIHSTRVILPALIARKHKSLILNIGSLSGRIPPPLTAVYGATKGGLQTWSRALAEEVKAQGVVVYMVLPGFVTTNMSKIRKTSWFVPSAATFVKSTLSSIGLPRGAQGRPHEMTPYWFHALADYATGLFGYLSEISGIQVIHYMHRDIRKRALKKKAREAGKGKVE